MKTLWKPNLVLCAAVVLAGAALHGGAVRATTALAPLSIEELTAHADVALEGQVVSLRSFEQDRQIFTEIRIQVRDAVKGSAGEIVTLKLYGGTVGTRRTRVVGAPCISAGEELFLFLAANGLATFDVVNLAEGSFRIIRRPGMPAEVGRDLQGIAYLHPAMPDIPTTLDALKAAVRASAAAR